ncbi:DNA-binding transcriptional LysR family regulator [Salirhabdus euzebyi]|uniref:DNA-binding transcriptional LysR family regulator n=1 Tax=Salirhabdus euzebyi TaxID=394506 RepID=A0A841Q5T5_9BACI|nr:LysR family transcriptional regulator [Salirhabdus euzebyi]MBB6453717.1 DNA-binding transcriptional LysR family regulator [Salirhabdus euzebyi]
MTEKDWELLLTLHKEGSITKAAQKLYISQPALTYRIKQIEKEFNSQIILRGSKGVVFTSEGDYLVKYAESMKRQLQIAKDNLTNMKNNIQGILRIGVSSNFAMYQLPNILEGFLAKFPNIEIDLTTGWSSKVLKLIQSEEIHVAIIRGDHVWSGEQITLNKEALCIASKKEIDLNNLPNQNLIQYQTDVSLKKTFDDWWLKTFNKTPKVSMEVDSIETCKGLVKTGLGYGIFPSICLEDTVDLHTMDLTIDNKKLLRKTSLLYRKELLDLSVVNAFVSFLKDKYNIVY